MFTPTSSMTAARQALTATLLPNGQVLIAGGAAGGAISRARSYTTQPSEHSRPPAAWPWQGLFTRRRCCRTGGTHRWRTRHDWRPPFRARSYTTQRPGHSPPPAARRVAREYFTATLLPNGKVLIAGGNRVFHERGAIRIALDGCWPAVSAEEWVVGLDQFMPTPGAGGGRRGHNGWLFALAVRPPDNIFFLIAP